MTQHAGDKKNLCNLKPILVSSMSDSFVPSRLLHHSEYKFGKDVLISHFAGKGEPLYKKVNVLKGLKSVPVYLVTVQNLTFLSYDLHLKSKLKFVVGRCSQEKN